MGETLASHGAGTEPTLGSDQQIAAGTACCALACYFALVSRLSTASIWIATLWSSPTNAIRGSSVPQHYATATVTRLLEAANKVQHTVDRMTLLRVVNG